MTANRLVARDSLLEAGYAPARVDAMLALGESGMVYLVRHPRVDEENVVETFGVFFDRAEADTWILNTLEHIRMFADEHDRRFAYEIPRAISELQRLNRAMRLQEQFTMRLCGVEFEPEHLRAIVFYVDAFAVG